MSIMNGAAIVFLVLAAVLHAASIVIAVLRARPRPPLASPPYDAPAVSIVRPVCGLENFLEETLRSTFLIDYPRVEILFCLAHADDDAAPLIRRLIADYPWIDARLLVGDERISASPKLNNMLKGWRDASHPFIVFADSNVLMPRDYVQRHLEKFDPATGLVCSPPAGARPAGLAAEIECAFLNGYQARWQLFADAMGYGFAQGKSMMWRRADLQAAGGLRALTCELAEDAASTKVVRAAGRQVRIVDAPFAQPIGRRALRDVWKRQVRWARLRRASFPLCFVPEILSGGLAPLAAAGLLAAQSGLPVLPVLLAAALLWYGGELALARAAGWPATTRTAFASILRDLMIPLLWLVAWRDSFEWRGNAMTVAEDDASPASLS
jgi:ceramide glucosyltransferase